MRREVWVKLDHIYRQLNYPPRAPRGTTPVLEAVGEVPGVLHRWERLHTGEWMGLASFSVPYLSRHPSSGLTLVEQLVPAEAIRPRKHGRGERGR